jgi:hypothetical protein
MLLLAAVVGFMSLMFKYGETPQQTWERIQKIVRHEPAPAPPPPVTIRQPEPEAPTAPPPEPETPAAAVTAAKPVEPLPAKAPDAVAWLLNHKQDWPTEVALAAETKFEMPAGWVLAQPGNKVKLVKLEHDFVTVAMLDSSNRLPVEATDLSTRAQYAMARPRPQPQFVPSTAEAVPPQQPARRLGGFVHPGLLHSKTDLERMRTKVEAGAHPWIDGWRVLTENSHAQLSYRPRPQGWICRGGACPRMGLHENYMLMARDAAAAYECALRYQISGDTKYAEKSAQIMDAWSGTLTNITGDSNWLLSGAGQGYQWANAAELMRDYRPWLNSGGFAKFQKFLLTRFYPGTSNFLQHHNGTCDTHYWANWDLFAMNTLLGIGVVCDRRDIYDEAVNYFQTGIGNGNIERAVYFIHPGNLGQTQESGRDQGHATLVIGLLGSFCEMAWNQGDDLYGYDNNRVLAGAEYIARYNLSEPVPYMPYGNCERWISTDVSSGSRGSRRPTWEVLYNHYVNGQGIAAPYVTQFAELVRPEGGGGNYGGNSGGYDQIGFGTLTATRDPLSKGAPPSGLRAIWTKGQITLSWWGSNGATNYVEQRDGKVIGNAGSLNTFFTDTNVVKGATYRYVISGDNGTQSRPLTVSQALVAEYLRASANLLPHSAEFADVTISARVYWEGGKPWQRIFDFGSGTPQNLFLTPSDGAGKLKFAITTTGGGGEQALVAEEALPERKWVNVTVTLDGDTGTLYLNGKAVATGPITIDPLFPQIHCYIGKSQYASDPPFSGKIEDVRIYNYALSAKEIK